MSGKLLVVEDDPDISRLLKINLTHMGFEVSVATDGAEGLKQALTGEPTLIILDVMLPKMDGLDVCQAIREQQLQTPILMLTARERESDKILGLDLGADDYLTKPFSMGELTARVRALLRRAAPAAQSIDGIPAIQHLGGGAIELDLAKRQAKLHGSELQLTFKEFELLYYLAKNAGRAFTRESLLSSVWDYEYEGYQHTVTSHINRLRSKIEQDPAQPRFILTVRGAGYRFATDEELLDAAPSA
ncbi:MAG: response regulator transcription factor [Bdellovibrionales bacterium]|nr:response regulator transcription factor [Bdellovibrionales bacterium]